jgi:hypothetical protein
VGWGAFDYLDNPTKWDQRHTGLEWARIGAHEFGHNITQFGHTDMNGQEGPGNLMENPMFTGSLLSGTTDRINQFYTFPNPQQVQAACKNRRHPNAKPGGGGGGGGSFSWAFGWDPFDVLAWEIKFTGVSPPGGPAGTIVTSRICPLSGCPE